MKKTLASILALSLAVSSFPLTVYAEPDADNSSDTWTTCRNAMSKAKEYIDLYGQYSANGIPGWLEKASGIEGDIERLESIIKMLRDIENLEKGYSAEDYVVITDDFVVDSIMESAQRCLTPEQYEEMTAEDGVYRLYYIDGYPVYVRDGIIEGLQNMDISGPPAAVVYCSVYVFEKIDNIFMAMNIRNSQLQAIEDQMTELGHWNIVEDVIVIKEKIKEQPYIIFNGKSGSDTYVLDADCGDVIINDYSQNNSGDADRLVFNYDVSAEDVILWRNGRDLIIADKEHGNYVDIIDYFSNGGDVSSKIETLEFPDGTALTYEEVCALTNIFIGTYGDDEIDSYQENNLIFGLAGMDTIVTHNGDDIVFGGDGDDVIQGYFGEDYYFGGAGNDVITGCSFIFSGGDTDVMIGGKDDDILSGKGGDDIYIYNLGDGNDTIIEDHGGGHDIVALGEGIEPDDVFVFMSEGKSTVNLLIEKTGEVISMPGRAISGFSVLFPVEEVCFADGTVWKGEDLAECMNIIGTDGNDRINDSGDSDIVWCGLGNDFIRGRSGDDTYVYDYGDGYDLIYDDTIWGSPNDTLRFADGITPDEIYAEKRGRFYYLYVRDMSGCVAVCGLETVVFSDGTEWTESSITENAHPASELYTDVKGDVNSDGKVSEADLLLMQYYLSEQGEINKETRDNYELPNISMADIDEDGSISISDYIYLKSMILESADAV